MTGSRVALPTNNTLARHVVHVLRQEALPAEATFRPRGLIYDSGQMDAVLTDSASLEHKRFRASLFLKLNGMWMRTMLEWLVQATPQQLERLAALATSEQLDKLAADIKGAPSTGDESAAIPEWFPKFDQARLRVAIQAALANRKGASPADVSQVDAYLGKATLPEDQAREIREFLGPGAADIVQYAIPEPVSVKELSNDLQEGAPFGGDANVQAFARALAEQQLRHEKPEGGDPDASAIEAKVTELDGDFWKTFEAFKALKTPANRLKHGWMVGRREQFEYARAGKKVVWPTKKFVPSADETPKVDIPDPVRRAGTTAGVLPYVAEFLKDLHGAWPDFNASTRNDGGTHGKGFGLDCYLTGSKGKTDSRELWLPENSVAFLHAVAQTASKHNLNWTVLYNDYKVGRHFPENVGFQGTVNAKGGQNWHGPLNMHFHLEVVPQGSE